MRKELVRVSSEFQSSHQGAHHVVPGSPPESIAPSASDIDEVELLDQDWVDFFAGGGEGSDVA